MDDLIDRLSTFYTIDSTTTLLIVVFCVIASYSVRDKLTNPASVIFLFPAFVLAAFTTYSIAIHLQMFSPKRPIEWVTFTAFSASIGAVVGILLVSILRVVQDKFITMAHIRQTLKRDEEQTARGYPSVDV
jgi:uncharacterized membrane protein YeiH